MNIAIGSDHAAWELKAAVIDLLNKLGHNAINMGTNGPQSVDYPDFGRAVAESVAAGTAERGILICGSGIGMSMVANKVAGIRAALCSEPLSARLSRQHNNANVLCMGARMIGLTMAEEIVRTWLETEFEAGRHQLRLDKISQFDKDISDEPGSCSTV